MSEIYTTLEMPIDLRKDLLKSNIKIIEMMEGLENLKQLRHNKHNNYLFLKAHMREIHSALGGLRSRFPHMKFDEEDKLRGEAEKIDIEFKGYVKPDKEIDKLQREMFLLKEKLKEID